MLERNREREKEIERERERKKVREVYLSIAPGKPEIIHSVRIFQLLNQDRKLGY